MHGWAMKKEKGNCCKTKYEMFNVNITITAVVAMALALEIFFSLFSVGYF